MTSNQLSMIESDQTILIEYLFDFIDEKKIAQVAGIGPVGATRALRHCIEFSSMSRKMSGTFREKEIIEDARSYPIIHKSLPRDIADWHKDLAPNHLTEVFTDVDMTYLDLLDSIAIRHFHQLGRPYSVTRIGKRNPNLISRTSGAAITFHEVRSEFDGLAWYGKIIGQPIILLDGQEKLNFLLDQVMRFYVEGDYNSWSKSNNKDVTDSYKLLEKIHRNQEVDFSQEVNVKVSTSASSLTHCSTIGEFIEEVATRHNGPRQFDEGKIITVFK